MQKIILEHNICDNPDYCESKYDICMYCASQTMKLEEVKGYCILFRLGLDKDPESGLFVKSEKCKAAYKAALSIQS